MSNNTGIFQGDIIFRTAIELSLDDMRKNPWLIEDCFSSLLENPILREKYGWKEINKAKEFILNNKIHVFMGGRMDKEEFPCVTINIGSSTEDDQLSTLGDLSPEVENYDPQDIGQPIPFIISPFNIESYDKDTGIVEIPEDIEEYRYIGAGMIAVDPETGDGFIIEEKAGNNGFKIPIGSELPGNKLAIVPQYQVYRARRERAISKEVYNIGCHAHGDPSTLIFLFSIVKYALFRYRESLLEHENFQLSSLSCSDLIKNGSFETENIYSRFITIHGQVEESWVKTPSRFIESIDLSEQTTDGLEVGIKILSQDAPEEIQDEEDIWVTIDDD